MITRIITVIIIKKIHFNQTDQIAVIIIIIILKIIIIIIYLFIIIIIKQVINKIYNSNSNCFICNKIKIN